MTKKTNTGAADPTKRLTMMDIAQMAGVDRSTVSRALADSPRLPQKTKEKIRKIVKETGFVANQHAKILRRQKSGQILVMNQDVASFSFPELVQGIEEAANDLGVGVLVGSSQNNNNREEAHGRLLLSGAVDGLLLLTGRLPECVSHQPGYERSVVSVSQPVPGSDIPYVAIDGAAAAKTAIEHLLSLAHKNIALIASAEEDPSVQVKIDAYRVAMKNAGLKSRIRIECTDESDMDNGIAGMTRLLTAREKPTAVFCTSDELAIGAMKKARQAGFEIPNDISFVGYDDLPLARAVDPPLTSIRVPLRKMGLVGMQMLMENFDSEKPKPQNRLLEHELIVRDSCGPAPAK